MDIGLNLIIFSLKSFFNFACIICFLLFYKFYVILSIKQFAGVDFNTLFEMKQQ